MKVIYLGILIVYLNIGFTSLFIFVFSSLFLSAFSWFGLAAQYDFPFDFLLSKQLHFQFVASFDWHTYWYILSMCVYTHMKINWNWKFFCFVAHVQCARPASSPHSPSQFHFNSSPSSRSLLSPSLWPDRKKGQMSTKKVTQNVKQLRI